MTAILAIDLGEKRIGVAIAEDELDYARPYTTLRRAGALDKDAAAIREIVDRYRVVELVVGLPVHMSGDEGEQARMTRQWGDAVAAALGLRIAYRDERLTSHLAEERIGPMKRGRSGGPPTRNQREAYRARVDREAAAIILGDELEARRAAAPITFIPERADTERQDE